MLYVLDPGSFLTDLGTGSRLITIGSFAIIPVVQIFLSLLRDPSMDGSFFRSSAGTWCKCSRVRLVKIWSKDGVGIDHCIRIRIPTVRTGNGKTSKLKGLQSCSGEFRGVIASRPCCGTFVEFSQCIVTWQVSGDLAIQGPHHCSVCSRPLTPSLPPQ